MRKNKRRAEADTVNQYSHFAIEESDVIRPQSDVDTRQWKLLRRLRLPDKFNDPQKGTIKRAMVMLWRMLTLYPNRGDVGLLIKKSKVIGTR